jgi:uracil-DNA glycosylase
MMVSSSMSETARRRCLDQLAADIAVCQICREQPQGKPLPHQPRPVVRLSATGRIAICGQAPGTRVHTSGIPFTDPSGDRLRQWMGVTPEEFYDSRSIALVPMGFCFPGHDAKGGDLPPRPECAATWHAQIFAAMPHIELIVLLGYSAMRWHLGSACPPTLSATVEQWQDYLNRREHPRYLPMPHPSWRNNGWLKARPWFEQSLLPVLRHEVRRCLNGRTSMASLASPAGAS